MICCKKAVCWICAFCFIIGCFPVNASATETVEEVLSGETEIVVVEESVTAEEVIPTEEMLAGETLTEDELSAEETAPTENEIPAEDDISDVSEGELYTEEESDPVQSAVNMESVAVEEEECIVTYHDIPLYFQTDYPDVRFGNGSIATSGCSITSVAMVATYLTNHVYLPYELANWFGRYGYNNVERLEYASDMLQLPYRKAQDIRDIMSELKNGNIAIVLVNANSHFTESQHFIVLKGITEDGRILVNDSYAPNYDKWELEDGFANGFYFEDIVAGYSGGWIYDVQAMPDDPFIYTSDEEPAFVEHWKEMPVYYQDDYPNDRFGMGTIATSGCAVTSLAMVASYMTGHEYLPDMLADWFGGYGANNVDRLEYASEMLQLPYRKAQNIHEVLDEVRNGNLAILLMDSKSVFTASQHFIVLTGLTTDGRFMVSDSYRPNHDNPSLQNGFQNGFTEEDFLKGYDGGWIYEINAMPEDPFIYVEEKPYVEPRYPGIELTWEEQQLLAKVIWVEARGESAEGQQAIAEVVFNRMLSEEFPDTLRGVIFAENQFRSVEFLDDAEPWQAQYDAIDDALEGPYVLPADVYYFATYAVNENVWGRIGGHIFCYQSGN